MKSDDLILHPTDTAQWHALVNEAQLASSLELHEDLESYLVFLLMRFISKPQMAHSVLAMEFLEGAKLSGRQAHDMLRDVGDKCLLLSGLFPGRAEKRRVKISYFVDLGQSAYGTISINNETLMSDLFANLCEEFVSMMDVLLAMRDLSGDSRVLLPLEALELWQDTGSQSAYQALLNAKK